MNIDKLKAFVKEAIAVIKKKNEEVNAIFMAASPVVTNEVLALLRHKDSTIQKQAELIEILVSAFDYAKADQTKIKEQFDQLAHWYAVEQMMRDGGFDKN